MVSRLRAIYRHNRWPTNDRPFELNILGVRAKSLRSNAFDDRIHVFWRDGKKWAAHGFAATTDPGTYWLNNPAMPRGTAILAQGRYEGAYAIGLHRGHYRALVQATPVTVIRDYDRDAYLDFYNGQRETGMFGINVHRAREHGATRAIDAFSAGCQVFKHAGDFGYFMRLCERHRAAYGNRFDYCLVDYRAQRRVARRRGAVAGVAIGLAGWLGRKYYT